MESRLMRASSQGARFMLLATILQRGMTFVLNTLLYRFVSAEVVGFAANDMELLLSTILFLSRDACRMVATRIPLDGPAGSSKGRAGGEGSRAARFQQLVNLAWLPVPLSLLIAGGALVFLHHGSDGSASAARLSRSIWLYCGAAMIESAAEPLVVLSAALMYLQVRPKAEMAMVLGRTLVTFTAAYASNGSLGGLCFALGQLAGALAYAASAVAAFRAAQRTQGATHTPPLSALLPRWSRAGCLSPSVLLGADTAASLATFTAQNAVKHVLTEGDRILLAASSTRAQRGTYGLVQNYGSLVPRLLFQPLEESLRALAAKLWWPGQGEEGSEGGSDSSSNKRGKSRVRRSASVSKRSASELHPQAAKGASELLSRRTAAVTVFLGCLRLVGTVGLLCAVVAAPLADVACLLLLGQHWTTGTEAPTALSASFVYVAFMAVNGATEAFATAVGTTARLRASTAAMVACFAAYAVAAVAGLHYAGVAGVLAANCVNMGLRALAAGVAIASSVGEAGAQRALQWRTALPHPVTLLLAVVTGSALWALRLDVLPLVVVSRVQAAFPPALLAAVPAKWAALAPRLALSAVTALPLAASLLVLDVPRLRATYAAVRQGGVAVPSKGAKTD